MSRQQTYAQAVREIAFLSGRYFAGFDDSNHTRQAPGLPNHFAWNLGHLAYILHRCAEKFDGKPLPESEFIVGGEPTGGGDARRFATKSVSMGSVPTASPKDYPGCARCVEIFNGAVERCASAFEGASDAALDADTAWGAATIKGWQFGPRMVWHAGMHTGEIADLRRAMGMARLIG